MQMRGSAANVFNLILTSDSYEARGLIDRSL
jgi:hypothetical protein